MWRGIFLAAAVIAAGRAGAETLYVSPSGGHSAPFTNWTGAATSIQAAVDAAADGDTILVTNGAYTLSQQVVVRKGVAIRSVNGPAVTSVDGAGTTRVFFVEHASARLEGFTVTNGVTDYDGGGVSISGGSRLESCVIDGNRARVAGGGVAVRDGSVVSNCVIRGNLADWFGGGGVTCGEGAVLKNSLIAGNEARTNADGGGVRCVMDGAVLDCVIVSNRARVGGGLQALFHSRVENCLVAWNTAAQGGGASISQYTVLQNCTVASNAAEVGGGVDAVFGGLARNTIVYGNSAPTGSNYAERSAGASVLVFDHACAAPLPPGSGNIAADPAWVDAGSGDFRLGPGSPCVDAGSAAGAPGHDLDGLPRPADGDTNGVAAADMGAYELQP